LADFNIGILGPEADLLNQHLDCISISNDWFQSPEGITLHFRISIAVHDLVVDIECLLLTTSAGSVEYIIKGDVM
jgi:hypothetical protein